MPPHASDIHTSRLKLVASTRYHLQVELDAPEMLGELLGALVPATWPPGLYDRDAMQFFLEKTVEGGEDALGWYGWYVIRLPTDVDTALLVATAGYVGPPSADGTVEIGYSVAPEVRGKGYATEIVQALIQRVFEDPRVRHVVAEVHESNAASLKVLSRCGFVRAGLGREEGHFRFEFRGNAV